MDLNKIYEEYGYPSLAKLIAIVKAKAKKDSEEPPTSKDIKKFYDEQVVGEVFKKLQKKKNGMIFSLYPDMIYQLDLVDMSKYDDTNEGFKWIAMIVDVYSRYLWAFPVKNKEARTMTEALKGFFDKHTPHELMTDKGGEYEGVFDKMLEKHNIHHYQLNTKVEGHKSLGVVDRLIRTFKNMIYKSFTQKRNTQWLSNLNSLVNAYNKTPHSFLKDTPDNVYHNPSPEYTGRLLEIRSKVNGIPTTYKVGDKVRIQVKGLFHRGFEGNYSKEVYTVDKVTPYNLIVDGKKVPVDEVISAKIPTNVVNVEEVVAKAKQVATRNELAGRKTEGFKRYYVVKKGRETGIFNTYAEVEKSITGFKGAEHKAFSTKKAAEEYLNS
jgi:hypothetical protein